MTIEKPSETVLEETPGRALKFLSGAQRNSTIYALLALRGYGPEAHEQGWQLLLAATGYRKPPPVVLQNPPIENPALKEVDAWDEPNFAVAHAALDFAYPDQSSFLFEDLSPQTGAGAIVSVTTFLDRLDALENGKDRKDNHSADKAALKKLAARGITKEERQRMRKLLEKAIVAPSADRAPPIPSEPSQKDDGKLALYAWYKEWSTIARAEIKRRDYLLHLGLTKRKPRAKGTPQAPAPGPDATEKS